MNETHKAPTIAASQGQLGRDKPAGVTGDTRPRLADAAKPACLVSAHGTMVDI
jgi:hypothetical protein